MPLRKGRGKKVISGNISKLVREPQKQAVAIAVARKGRKKRG